MRNLLCLASLIAFSPAAHAEKKLDLVTRFTDVDCKGGDAHFVKMSWDSARSQIEPVTLSVDGKAQSPLLMFGYDPEMKATQYTNPVKQFAIVIPPKLKNGKTFESNVTIEGKPVHMSCTYKTKLRFLRVRGPEAEEAVHEADPERAPIERSEVPAAGAPVIEQGPAPADHSDSL